MSNQPIFLIICNSASRENSYSDYANIIFLLSDGDVNVGLQNWSEIRKKVRGYNQGRFAIFAFAIGSNAPYDELEKLSIQNNGLARQVCKLVF